MAIKEHLNQIADQAEQYAEAKIEEAGLKTVQQSVNILSGVLAWLFIVGIGILVLLALSVVLFLILAELLASTLGASLILFGFYGLIFIVLIFNYKRLLIKPVKNFLLGQFLSSYKIKEHE